MKKDKIEIPWDILKAQIEETSKQWADSMRRHDEYNKKFEKSQERFEKIEAKIDKTLEEIRISNKKWGNLDNNVGAHAEQYFQDSLAESLTFCGEKYDFIDCNLHRRRDNIEAEFDIILVNGKSVALIEAKHKLHTRHIENLVENKVPKFRKLFSEYKKHKIYLGVAGFSWDDDVVNIAKDYGIGVIRQKGKSIEVLADNLKAY